MSTQPRPSDAFPRVDVDEIGISERYGSPDRLRAIRERRARRREKVRRLVFFWKR